MHAADDPDDVEVAVDAVADVQALADRILVPEVLLDEGLVDDRDMLAGRRVLRGERAAAEQWNRERLEVRGVIRR